MDNTFYNSEFENKLFKAIELVRQDNNNKNLLINLLKNDFDSNKATLFEMFRIGEDGTSILSAEQQKVLFDNLQDKQKGALFKSTPHKARLTALH